MYRYTCPTCKIVIEVARRDDARFRPFCSDRCKMIDLGRWFNEEYRVSEPLSGASEDQPANRDEIPDHSALDRRPVEPTDNSD